MLCGNFKPWHVTFYPSTTSAPAPSSLPTDAVTSSVITISRWDFSIITKILPSSANLFAPLCALCVLSANEIKKLNGLRTKQFLAVFSHFLGRSVLWWPSESGTFSVMSLASDGSKWLLSSSHEFKLCFVPHVAKSFLSLPFSHFLNNNNPEQL